jgi:hypothetical protein
LQHRSGTGKSYCRARSDVGSERVNLCILRFSSIPPCFINSAGILSNPAALCVLSFSITWFTS